MYVYFITGLNAALIQALLVNIDTSLKISEILDFPTCTLCKTPIKEAEYTEIFAEAQRSIAEAKTIESECMPTLSPIISHLTKAQLPKTLTKISIIQTRLKSLSLHPAHYILLGTHKLLFTFHLLLQQYRLALVEAISILQAFDYVYPGNHPSVGVQCVVVARLAKLEECMFSRLKCLIFLSCMKLSTF